MKKILVCLIVVMLIILSIIPATSFAVSNADIQSVESIEKQCADALYELGLFEGTGVKADGTPEYSLAKEPTRAEAITMLVRLLGKEKEAMSKEWITPFTDVQEWAKPYVGYAYNNGLTDGMGKTIFGSTKNVSETQYLTIVLRALGYSDEAGDFIWDEAKELSDKIGLTNENIDYGENFNRGSIVVISYSALSVEKKDSNSTLFDSLIEQQAIQVNSKSNAVAKQEEWKKVWFDYPGGYYSKYINSGIADGPFADLPFYQFVISLNPSESVQIENEMLHHCISTRYDNKNYYDLLIKYVDDNCGVVYRYPEEREYTAIAQETTYVEVRDGWFDLNHNPKFITGISIYIAYCDTFHNQVITHFVLNDPNKYVSKQLIDFYESQGIDWKTQVLNPGR